MTLLSYCYRFVTNFAFLYTGYPHNVTGVLASYTAGVPFFWRTLASDLIYSGVFFGLHAWLSRTVVRSAVWWRYVKKCPPAPSPLSSNRTNPASSETS